MMRAIAGPSRNTCAGRQEQQRAGSSAAHLPCEALEHYQDPWPDAAVKVVWQRRPVLVVLVVLLLGALLWRLTFPLHHRAAAKDSRACLTALKPVQLHVSVVV
jgi:hypothetical protein